MKFKILECIMSTSIFFKPSHIKDELTNTDCDDERDDSILVCDQETSSLEEGNFYLILFIVVYNNIKF